MSAPSSAPIWRQDRLFPPDAVRLQVQGIVHARTPLSVVSFTLSDWDTDERLACEVMSPVEHRQLRSALRLAVLDGVSELERILRPF